ncbi:GTP-binding protein [Cyanobium sp. FGCU-6]|nr:GTP-binding protein [Cyanobium sp. FGCU6]
MSPATLPVTVIGGYLGAGKTTLLNHLLADAGGRRIAVLVNDFGSLNIDAALVHAHAGDTIELANGCLCCSLLSGFAEVLSQVKARAAAFDHVVIEASGVAEPLRVAEQVQGFGFTIDARLVVVDGERIERQAADRYVGDVVRRQLRQADLLLLNKLDLIDDGQRLALHAVLEALAPGIPRLETVRGQVPMELLLGHRLGSPLPSSLSDPLLDSGAGGDPGEAAHRHGERFETWILRSERPLSRAALERFTAALPAGIHRAKGFVLLADAPARAQLFQLVGNRWSLEPAPSGSAPAGGSALVLIGHRGAATTVELQKLLAGDPLHR